MQDLEGLLVRLAGEARLDGSRVALAGSGEGAALALGFAALHPGRAAAIAASGGLAGAGASIAARIATPLLLAEDASAAAEARRIRARLQAEHEPAWLLLVSDGAGFGAPARARFLEAAEAQFLRGILLR
jgi:hypothetical protein